MLHVTFSYFCLENKDGRYEPYWGGGYSSCILMKRGLVYVSLKKIKENLEFYLNAF